MPYSRTFTNCLVPAKPDWRWFLVPELQTCLNLPAVLFAQANGIGLAFTNSEYRTANFNDYVNKLLTMAANCECHICTDCWRDLLPGEPDWSVPGKNRSCRTNQQSVRHYIH
jgi:hypothetical protein